MKTAGNNGNNFLKKKSVSEYDFGLTIGVKSAGK